MAAYYSENDPFAAAWLRELIADGLIADGEVDEQSIADVSADDVRGFTQCHFFAGIGGWSYALRLAGWADSRFVWTGSAPCQPFSAAGAQAGGHDPRDLWPVWFQLIAECRPRVVFGEQVEAAIGHGWLDRLCDDLEAEGYAIGACGLPAASVGAFHIRQRLWFVADREEYRLEGRDHIRGLRQEPAADSAAGGLANTEYRGGIGRLLHGSSESDGAYRGRAYGEPAESSAAGDVADADGRYTLDGELQRRGEHGLRAESGCADGAARDGERGEGIMADTDRAGSNRQRGEGLSGDSHASQRHDADGCGESGGVGDGVSQRLEGLERHGDGGHESRRLDTEQARPVTTPSAVDWTAAEWLPCSDGKARPTQSVPLEVFDELPPELGYLCDPGAGRAWLSPLMTGAPNRVGRLRGYGNAIHAGVAAAFIAAYMDIA